MWEIQLLGLVVLILSPLQVESIPIDTQTEGVIPDKLITVDQTSISFKRGGLPYKFAGLNFWSAPFLDFDRLTNELDLLKQYNISNFRIMALTEGGWIDGNTLASNGPRRLDPAVSNNPCSYESIDGNIDIGLIQHAENLRKVLIELAKRDMSAVLVLNNEYYWSGGMPQYMKGAYEAYSKRQYNGYWDCYDQFDQPNLANYLFQPRWYSLDVLRQYDNYANTLYNFWLEFDDQEGCYAIPKNHTFHMPVPNTLEGDAKSQSWNDMMRLSQLFMCNRRAQYYFLRRTQKLIQLVTQSGTQEEKALVRNGIMSWQLANEPRCFYRWDYICTDWIRKTVNLIKSVDNEHLVSLGSEGLLPSSWGKYANVGYAAYHIGTGLDYLTIHAWPENWGWYSKDNRNLEFVKTQITQYVNRHLEFAQALRKPIVLEESGLARDGYYDIGSSVTQRDEFFNFLIQTRDQTNFLEGLNFWAWGGYGVPSGYHWHKWNDYIGDPPHEHQGWYSVFEYDDSTLKIIGNAN